MAADTSRSNFRINLKPTRLVSRACDVIKEAHNGCKIENSQCLCSFGCKSEFRYQTKKECTDALKVLCKLGPFSCVCERSYLTSFSLELHFVPFYAVNSCARLEHIIKSRSRFMLQGISNDICSRAPCINGGSCIQISLSPGYKCRCEGTKHHGQ